MGTVLDRHPFRASASAARGDIGADRWEALAGAAVAPGGLCYGSPPFWGFRVVSPSCRTAAITNRRTGELLWPRMPFPRPQWTSWSCPPPKTCNPPHLSLLRNP